VNRPGPDFVIGGKEDGHHFAGKQANARHRAYYNSPHHSTTHGSAVPGSGARSTRPRGRGHQGLNADLLEGRQRQGGALVHERSTWNGPFGDGDPSILAA
jgi:hypothetical protein